MEFDGILATKIGNQWRMRLTDRCVERGERDGSRAIPSGPRGEGASTIRKGAIPRRGEQNPKGPRLRWPLGR